MFSFRKSIVAIAAMAAGLAALTPGAAFAYPEPTDVQITLDLSASSMIGGTDLTIHAIAKSGEQDPPGVMTVSAFGKNYVDNDNDLTITVSTPVVDAKAKHKVKAEFVPTDNADATATATATATASGSYRTASTYKYVTLMPRGDITPDSNDPSTNGGNGGNNGNDNADSGGLLPNTGGPAFWFLILGIALLALGAGVLAVRGRRSSQFS